MLPEVVGVGHSHLVVRCMHDVSWDAQSVITPDFKGEYSRRHLRPHRPSAPQGSSAEPIGVGSLYRFLADVV